MSLMLKLSTALVVTTLLANADFNLEEYVKKDLIKNPQITVNGVELLEKRDTNASKDWKAYMFLMNLKVKGKDGNYPETIFVNEKEGLVSMGLYDLKSHQQVGKNFRPEIGADYYNDAHLIAGKKDAKHKLVVFSDPVCPFCQQNVPTIYKTVKENPDTFALYYYHMPLLRIHPVSDVLTRAMEVLQKQGKFDDAMKMYTLNIPISEKDPKKILAAIKKQFNVDITQEQIDAPDIKEAIKNDTDKATRVMLKGTPTVYIDGKYDPEVTSYKKLLKK
jgi:thiol:disulfide interchange protein DsbC